MPSHISRVPLSLLGVMNPFAKGEFLRPEGDAEWVRSLWMTFIGAIGFLCIALPNAILATGKLNCPLLGALDPSEQALVGPVTGVGSDASLQPKEDSSGVPILEVSRSFKGDVGSRAIGRARGLRVVQN